MKKLRINTIYILMLLLTSFVNGQEIIYSAARSNNIELLKEQISLKNLDINSIDERGSTALIIACYNNNVAAATVLLENGANPNIQDKMGNTALMGVCFKRYENIARLLIKYKTDIDQRNFNGATALIFAATFGADSIVELLVNNGADVRIRDNYKKTALDYALLQENTEAVKLLR